MFLSACCAVCSYNTFEGPGPWPAQGCHPIPMPPGRSCLSSPGVLKAGRMSVTSLALKTFRRSKSKCDSFQPSEVFLRTRKAAHNLLSPQKASERWGSYDGSSIWGSGFLRLQFVLEVAWIGVLQPYHGEFPTMVKFPLLHSSTPIVLLDIAQTSPPACSSASLASIGLWLQSRSAFWLPYLSGVAQFFWKRLGAA